MSIDLDLRIIIIPARKKIPPPTYRYMKGSHELKNVGIEQTSKKIPRQIRAG